MTAQINAEIQKLAPTAVVELFELDATALGEPTIIRFHAGTNELRSPVVWQGNTYNPFPIQASGFEYTGNGQLPRPKLAVANITGIITALVLQYQDLLGAKITRKRTHARFLDAVNFAGGVNPTADPTAEYPDDIYSIDRKSLENREVVEFELATAFDVAGTQIPRRPIIQGLCTWLAIGGYRGTYCGYADTRYFNVDDVQVSTLAEDRCAGRLSSCKIRFGATSELPFGGFPGAGLMR